MKEHKDYLLQFCVVDSEKYIRILDSMKTSNGWKAQALSSDQNSLCDLVPLAISQLLMARVRIYCSDGGMHDIYPFIGEAHRKNDINLTLIVSDAGQHYDIATVKP